MNLDDVVGAFSDDGVYEDSRGGRHQGKAAIRTAFEPLLTGAMGQISFDDEDFLAISGIRNRRRGVSGPETLSLPYRHGRT